MNRLRPQAPPTEALAAEPVYVTRPYLPPLEELQPLLEEMWRTGLLSNDGPFHTRFRSALAAFLGVKHVIPVTNATLGLIVALRSIGTSGEVITTPFSFVASSQAINWAGMRPVFVDIEPDGLGLDPERIEAAITPDTKAILPVHVFGRRCDVTAIERIAAHHGIPVIYDAAHAFGVEDSGGSIARHGALSVLSFHATKVVNTFEGGAVVSNDAGLAREVDRLRDFGYADDTIVESIGLNAKMNEFSAALGLVQLKHFDEPVRARERIDEYYRELLRDVNGIRCLDFSGSRKHNYYNFPIVVGEDFALTRETLCERLNAESIYPRKYFYPLISEQPIYRDLPSAASANLPVATDMGKRILCLPQFPGLSRQQQERIVALIAGTNAIRRA
jgi:dTDP-4-amino-4,6-dideoxygalactose transaminase